MPDSQAEVPKAASGEAGKRVEQYSKEQIIQALESGTGILANELNNPQNQLTPDHRWAFYSIKGAQEQHGTDPANRVDLKSGKDTFTNTFTDDRTGKIISQEEGIPVEDLILFLNEMIPGTSDAKQRADIQNTVKILQKSSHTYTQLHPTNGKNKQETPQFQARKKQEANLISKDIRASGSVDEDWHKAEETLKSRRELRFPPQKPQTVAPETESSFDETPSAWDNQPTVETIAPAPNPEAPDLQNTPDLTNPTPATSEVPPTSNIQPETEQVLPITQAAEENQNQEPEVVVQNQDLQHEFFDSFLINATNILDKKSRLLAGESVSEFLRSGKNAWEKILRWPKKVLVRLTEGAAVDIANSEIRRAMVAGDTSLLHSRDVRNIAGQINQAIEEGNRNREAVLQRIKAGNVTEQEQVVEATGPFRDALIADVIGAIAHDTESRLLQADPSPDRRHIRTQADVQKALGLLVREHLNDQQVQQIFGAGEDVSDFGRIADVFASDILEMGLRVKDSMQAHNESLAQIDQYIHIHLTAASSGPNTDVRSFTDRLVAQARRRDANLAALGRTPGLSGVILNPFTVAIAASIASQGLLRSLGVVEKVAGLPTHFLLGAGTGGVVAGIRNYIETGKDSNTHNAGRAEGGDLPDRPQAANLIRRLFESQSGMYKRQELERFRDNYATPDQLLSGLGNELFGGAQRQSVQTLLGLDFSQQANRDIAINRVAEIKSRINNGISQNRDYLQHTSPAEWDNENNSLLEAAKSLEQALINAGGFDPQNVLNARMNWTAALDRDHTEKQNNFRGYRAANALKAGFFATGVGVAGGAVLHKGMEVFGIGVTPGTPEAVRPTTGPNIETIKTLYQHPIGEPVELGNNLSVGVNPDHTVSFYRDFLNNQLVPDQPQVEVNPDGHFIAHGDLPPEIRDQLNSDGFKINQLEAASVTHTDGGNVLDQLLSKSPDQLKQQGILETDQFQKTWNFHVLRPDIVSSTGMHTHNELTLHVGGLGRGSAPEYGFNWGQGSGQPGFLNFGGEIHGGEIQSHLFGVPPKIDAGLNELMQRSGGLKLNQMVMTVDLTDGRQIMLALDAAGNTHLPDGLYDPTTGALHGIKSIASTVIQGPDGNIIPAQDILNSGQIPGGSIVHSLASEKFPEIPIPPTPPIDIIKPPIFEIIPPEAQPVLTPLPGEIPWIPIPFAPRHPLEPLVLPPMIDYPSSYNFNYELFRKPDGTLAKLADIIRLRSSGAERDARIANLFPPRTPQEGTSSEAHIPEPVASAEGEQALALIHETFTKSDHIYLSLSGAIGDVVIDTAYLEGIRQYTEQLGQQKKVTLITPSNIVPLLEPLAQKYGYEIVTQERYKGVEKALALIEEQKEQNALVLEFEHHTGRPVVDVLPNGGLVVNDLFAASVGLYDNGRSGNEKFTAFFSDLMTIPENQRTSIKPHIELPANSNEIYEQLQRKYSIDSSKEQVAVVIEASHQMKRYSLQNWQQVLKQISTERPNTEFNIIFNPTGGTYTQQQLQSALGTVPGIKFVSGNMVETEVLLAHQKLVLANDTGFAHVAAVLDNGPQVISLHIPIFPPNTWVTNTKRHIGLMPQNSLLTNEFRSEETDESQKWINKIPPTEVIQNALRILTSQPTPEILASEIPEPVPPTARLNQLQNQMSAIAEQMKSSTFAEGQRLGGEMQRVVTEFNRLTKRASRTPTPPAPAAATNPTPAPAPPPETPAPTPEQPNPIPETLASEITVEGVTPEQRQKIDQELLNTEAKKALYTREFNEALAKAIIYPNVNGRNISALIPVYIELRNGQRLQVEPLNMGRVFRFGTMLGPGRKPPDEETGAITMQDGTVLSWDSRWGIRKVIIGEGDTVYPEGTEHINSQVVFDRDKYILENNINLNPAAQTTEILSSEIPLTKADAAEYTIGDHTPNQDSVLSDPEHGFIGVFDGVSGEPAGDIASKIVSSNISQSLQTLPLDSTTQQVYEGMTQGYQNAIQALREHEKDNPADKGMCTTGSAFKLYSENGITKGMFMHAGDSRIYAVRKDGSIQQLTEDDSSLTQAVRSGKITPEQAKEIINLIDNTDNYSELPDFAKPYWATRNEIVNVFYSNQQNAPIIQSGIIGPDTAFIITTSDGVHDNLKASEISAICNGKTDPQEIAKALVDAAREVFLAGKNGRSKRDDVSAAVIKIPQLKQTAPSLTSGQI
ncbi:MAG: protein phosphatase 2C domain-containing protein [Candidatus Daviesbacteria bacterium]|nr:protein phosphatase 2C domain-containing protein [Candidatus Daviesbacteria bacterium]